MGRETEGNVNFIRGSINILDHKSVKDDIDGFLCCVPVWRIGWCDNGVEGSPEFVGGVFE